MDSSKQDKILAAGIAICFHLVLLLSFCSYYLSWPPEDADDPRLLQDSTEILLVSDYINLGDMITNVKPADAPAGDADGETLSDASDIVNAGEPATPAPVATSERESPAKVVKKPQPEKQGPTKEEIEAEQKAKREQAARDKINRQVKFGGGNGGGDGISGTESGTAVSGSPQGTPGHNLAGRTIVKWGANSSRKSGTIHITVTVNPKGDVIEASFAGGNGAASGDMNIRNRTIAATKATKFSPLPDGSKNQKGTITWNFK